MDLKRWGLPIRILIAIVVGFGMLTFIYSGVSKGGGLSPSDKFVGLIVSILYGFVLFYLFGWPMIQHVVDRFGTLYTGSNENFRIAPEYSVAEARAQAGKYQEAIDEYRQVILKYPDDMYPHLRIADIALKHLQDVNTAELDLMTALAKASGADSSSLAAGRLADLYQLTLHNPGRALDVMKQLREKIPGTKQANLAEERIAILEKIVIQGEPVPEPPQKIAHKPSRYKMTE
jgi:predicted negative regulator of RcsB-dependent stress response